MNNQKIVSNKFDVFWTTSFSYITVVTILSNQPQVGGNCFYVVNAEGIF